MHPLVELAAKAVNAHVKDGKRAEPPVLLTDEMKLKAGVFVSIHKGESLRGCIGTMAPTKANVAEEIIANAIAAAVQDPRFPPVKAEELEGLTYSVDVLDKPEKVKSAAELDAKKYGVIVAAGAKRGLLLPDLEGINTPEQQIEICRRKAWIDKSEPVELYRFKVHRYH